MSVYRTTVQADEDLIAIYIQGYDLFGLRQADKYLDDLKATFQRLADRPGMTWLRMEFDPPIRVFTYKSHIVIYVEEPDGIVIVRVRHGHEDWLNDPRGERTDKGDLE